MGDPIDSDGQHNLPPAHKVELGVTVDHTESPPPLLDDRQHVRVLEASTMQAGLATVVRASSFVAMTQHDPDTHCVQSEHTGPSKRSSTPSRVRTMKKVDSSVCTRSQYCMHALSACTTASGARTATSARWITRSAWPAETETCATRDAASLQAHASPPAPQARAGRATGPEVLDSVPGSPCWVDANPCRLCGRTR